MRKHLASFLLASAILSVPALAADMAVKAAPIANPFINPSASGWYWLVGTYAGVAQSSVSGNPLLVTSLATGNLTAAGAGVDLGFGYIHGDTTKLGIGNLTLSGTNGYDGLTNVNAGTLTAGSTSALGANTAGTPGTR